MIDQYGLVHAINLLGSKENEAILTNAYDRHLQTAMIALGEDNIGITHFDFHNAVRIGGHESVIRDLPSVKHTTYATAGLTFVQTTGRYSPECGSLWIFDVRLNVG